MVVQSFHEKNTESLCTYSNGKAIISTFQSGGMHWNVPSNHKLFPNQRQPFSGNAHRPYQNQPVRFAGCCADCNPRWVFVRPVPSSAETRFHVIQNLKDYPKPCHPSFDASCSWHWVRASCRGINAFGNSAHFGKYIRRIKRSSSFYAGNC